MPSIKTLANEFFNIKIDRMQKLSKGVCKICAKELCDTIGNYNNFRRHVEHVHKKEYKARHKELLDKEKKINEDKPISVVPIQTQITKIDSDTTKYDKKQPKQIAFTKSVIKNLIVDCGLPFSLVEQQGFIDFQYTIDPKLARINRNEITEDNLPYMVLKLKDRFVEILSNVNKICITVDIWTDRRLRSFIGVTGHFIDSFWKLQSILLQFNVITGEKTGERIASEYLKLIHEYKLEGKILRATTDSGSNVKKAYTQDIFSKKVGSTLTDNLLCDTYNSDVREDNEDSFRLFMDDEEDNESNEAEDKIIEKQVDAIIDNLCKTVNICDGSQISRLACFAHSIQLVIKDGLEGNNSVKQFMGKILRVTSASHKSSHLAEGLRKSFGLVIPTPVITRWNTHFKCVKRIFSFDRNKFNDLLTECDYSSLCLSTVDYEKMNEFILIMQGLNQASECTQGDYYPTISLIAPTVVSLFKHFSFIESKCTYFKSLIRTLIDSLTTRFAGIIYSLKLSDIRIDPKHESNYNDNIYLMSSILDPSRKDKWLMSIGKSSLLTNNIIASIKNNLLAFAESGSLDFIRN
jgi:hypothetical protein